MTSTELLRLMERFRIAYAKADRRGLLAVTSDDFQWHQHTTLSATDLPTGRVLTGVDAVLEEIMWRRMHWQGVAYKNLQERATEDMLVQTFTISGEVDGVAFHADAVDLYPVRNGLITLKDTYWKYSS